MMTVPNTLGLFECHLPEIVEICHKVDALLYYDGANLNAILGKLRVGDAGFDVVHLNLHKTFATPHGGGGPGSGPVGVSERLMPYLPVSRVVQDESGRFSLSYDHPKSIGYVAPFYGNFGVVLKAYAYILRLGREGLVRVSESAVLAANYLRKRLADAIEVPYNRTCMRAWAENSQKRLIPGDWVVKFVPGDGKTFDVGYDYTSCGAFNYFKAQGAAEVAPYFCLNDFLASRAQGTGLSRQHTLAQGDSVCDFRYKRDRPVTQDWDTEVPRFAVKKPA